MDLRIGEIYGGKYRILRLLGQGAMGAVYQAENVRISRHVAVKVLHAGVVGRADVVQRFEREAQAAGRIGSRHIVEVLDLGELPDGSRYMVMEFLEGTTLEQRIRSRGRLLPEEISPIAIQLLDGLGGAHRAGIIHRDLKPANVFLAPGPNGDDFVKILDFGVSKFSAFNEVSSMTSTGAVLGTPYYMSPEQAKGSRGIDARSDLYSVGVILYESITGQVPFSAQTFNELIFRIVLESPPPAESFVPNLDPTFAGILRRAMAREPDQRYSTAEELRDALSTWLTQPLAQTMVIRDMPVIGLGGTVVMDSRPPPSVSGYALQQQAVEAPVPSLTLPFRNSSVGAWAAVAAGCVTVVAMLAVGFRRAPIEPAQLPESAPAALNTPAKTEPAKTEVAKTEQPPAASPAPAAPPPRPIAKTDTPIDEPSPDDAPANHRPTSVRAQVVTVDHPSERTTEHVTERAHASTPVAARAPERDRAAAVAPTPPPAAAPAPAPAAPEGGNKHGRTISTDL